MKDRGVQCWLTCHFFLYLLFFHCVLTVLWQCDLILFNDLIHLSLCLHLNVIPLKRIIFYLLPVFALLGDIKGIFQIF